MFKQHVSEEGQGLMEYALVLVFVAIVVIAILTAFSEQNDSTMPLFRRHCCF